LGVDHIVYGFNQANLVGIGFNNWTIILLLHDNKNRSKQPFSPVNIGPIPIKYRIYIELWLTRNHGSFFAMVASSNRLRGYQQN
jgi:hypothetical protein